VWKRATLGVGAGVGEPSPLSDWRLVSWDQTERDGEGWELLGILYGTATSGCEQPATISRSSSLDGRILVQNPVFEDRRDVAGGAGHQ
jgi:hypothetical protein